MSLKQFFVTLGLCVALVQVGVHRARAEPPYQVTVEDEFGNPLPTFPHRGEVFAMGRDGQRYNVRITNHTSLRVEAVVSVDGRDVISGKPGDFRGQRGYLVSPYSSVLIEGFRTSMEAVAAFRFTDPGNSYSARMGTPEHVGIIGAAFFPEAAPVPMPRPYSMPAPRHDWRGGAAGSYKGESGARGPSRSRAPAGAPSAPAESSDGSGYAATEAPARDARPSNIGTEYGEAQYSNVTEVRFQRARPRSPARVITLRYDDREGLEARGIVTRPRPYRQPEPGPVAFPENRFAPPPPPSDWR